MDCTGMICRNSLPCSQPQERAARISTGYKQENGDYPARDYAGMTSRPCHRIARPAQTFIVPVLQGSDRMGKSPPCPNECRTVSSNARTRRRHMFRACIRACDANRRQRTVPQSLHPSFNHQTNKIRNPDEYIFYSIEYIMYSCWKHSSPQRPG